MSDKVVRGAAMSGKCSVDAGRLHVKRTYVQGVMDGSSKRTKEVQQHAFNGGRISFAPCTRHIRRIAVMSKHDNWRHQNRRARVMEPCSRSQLIPIS